AGYAATAQGRERWPALPVFDVLDPWEGYPLSCGVSVNYLHCVACSATIGRRCCLRNEQVPPLPEMTFRNGVMVAAKPPQPPLRASAARPASRSMLLAENEKLAGGPVPLFQELSDREQKEVLAQGTRRVIRRRQMLFAQGTPHDGIYLIQSGRMRVFYTAPSGREITLAYWHQGNFVGGPEVFGTGLHLWSGAAMTDCSLVHFPGKVLRRLVLQIPSLAIGVIEGLAFKGKCYSALAQMLGTRSI